MALRLILVGLVAGLGLSLPSRRDFETLGRVAHDWVDARFADHRVARATAARPALVRNAGHMRGVVAREQAGPSVGILTFVSLPSTQAAILPVPIVEVSRLEVDSATIPALDVPGLAAPDVSAAEIEPATLEPPLVLTQNEEVPSLAAPILSAPDEPPVAAPATAVESEKLPEVVSEVVVAAEPVAPPAEEMTGANEVVAEVAAPIESLTAVEPAGLSDLDRAFQVAMEDVTTTFSADLATTDASESDREFASVVDAMASSFAEDATRLAEAESRVEVKPDPAPETVATQKAEASAPAAPVAEGEADRLTHAVRLTREAVFAWASLLHGPAVVTISR